jgi:circadian clock protein KaiC
LRDNEAEGERTRTIYILKSRGIGNSNQLREFTLTDNGVKLRNVYVGPSGVLTGTARLNMEAAEKAQQLVLKEQLELGQEELKTKKILLDTRINAMRAEFALQKLADLKVTAQQQDLATLDLKQREEKRKIRASLDTISATPPRAKSRRSA